MIIDPGSRDTSLMGPIWGPWFLECKTDPQQDPDLTEGLPLGNNSPGIISKLGADQSQHGGQGGKGGW